VPYFLWRPIDTGRRWYGTGYSEVSNGRKGWITVPIKQQPLCHTSYCTCGLSSGKSWYGTGYSEVPTVCKKGWITVPIKQQPLCHTSYGTCRLYSGNSEYGTGYSEVPKKKVLSNCANKAAATVLHFLWCL